MFCPKCGVQVPDDGTFCPMCGADMRVPVEAATPQPAVAPQPQPGVPPQPQPPVPPQPAAPTSAYPAPPQPVAPAPVYPAPGQPAYPAPPQPGVAPAHGYPAASQPAAPPQKGNKGAVIAAIVVFVLLSLAGTGVAVFFVLRSLGDKPTPTTPEQPAVEAPSPPQESASPEEPRLEVEPGETVGAVNAETAVDAVGNLLNSLKNNEVDAARQHATRYFQEEQDWFFTPAGGALIQFEVSDVYQDAALWVVEVDEEWNSGPQKSRYFVIEEDNTARVDSVEFLDQ